MVPKKSRRERSELPAGEHSAGCSLPRLFLVGRFKIAHFVPEVSELVLYCSKAVSNS